MGLLRSGCVGQTSVVVVYTIDGEDVVTNDTPDGGEGDSVIGIEIIYAGFGTTC